MWASYIESSNDQADSDRCTWVVRDLFHILRVKMYVQWTFNLVTKTDTEPLSITKVIWYHNCSHPVLLFTSFTNCCQWQTDWLLVTSISVFSHNVSMCIIFTIFRVNDAKEGCGMIHRCHSWWCSVWCYLIGGPCGKEEGF